MIPDLPVLNLPVLNLFQHLRIIPGIRDLVRKFHYYPEILKRKIMKTKAMTYIPKFNDDSLNPDFS